MTAEAGSVMPFMICLMLATGVMAVTSARGASRAARPPATTNAMPLINSPTLTTNSQCTVRMFLHPVPDCQWKKVSRTFMSLNESVHTFLSEQQVDRRHALQACGRLTAPRRAGGDRARRKQTKTSPTDDTPTFS